MIPGKYLSYHLLDAAACFFSPFKTALDFQAKQTATMVSFTRAVVEAENDGRLCEMKEGTDPNKGTDELFEIFMNRRLDEFEHEGPTGHQGLGGLPRRGMKHVPPTAVSWMPIL